MVAELCLSPLCPDEVSAALGAWLLLLVAVFFFVVKPMYTLNRLRGASSEEVANEIELLTEIRDELRGKRGSN